jgi:hypothetical protein
MPVAMATSGEHGNVFNVLHTYMNIFCIHDSSMQADKCRLTKESEILHSRNKGNQPTFFIGGVALSHFGWSLSSDVVCFGFAIY